ncbi:MAG: glycosyltransferase family 39 protein [Anaerolineae bacterium]|nr:glycosyltransferase family 39 protein [Anaerolineae bacterium]
MMRPACRLVLLYAAVALLYSVIVPFGEPPDEGAHYAYILHLLKQRRLPEQSFNADQNEVKEGHHPPLYYALVALLTGWCAPYQPYHQHLNPYLPIGYDDPQAVQQFLHPLQERFPWHGPLLAAHIARLVSVAMGCLSLLITFRLAANLSPNSKWLPLLAAGTLAFVPQFTYISAAINNDNGAVLAGALLTWQMMRLLRPLAPRSRIREVALLGLLWGGGILCKVSLLAMLPAIAGTLLLGREARRPTGIAFALKQAALDGLLVCCTAGLVSGWWFWRNLQLYGDPIGWNVWMATYSEFARKLPLSWDYAGRFLWDQFTSFWGRFGWGRVLLPTGLYLALLVLTLAGLWGLARHLQRTPSVSHPISAPPIPHWRSRKMAVLLVIVGSFLAATWRLGLSQDTVAAQGRFLFPALPAIATLLTVGWAEWWPQERREKACRLLLGGPPLLSICVALCLLLPVHTQPIREQLPSNAQVVSQGALGEWWEIIGWSAPAPTSGKDWPLTLYWRARRPLTEETRRLAPYRYIRLLDLNGQVLAGSEGVPTHGRFPPPAWSPDVIVADTARLRLSSDVRPGLVNILVGFRFREGEDISRIIGQAMIRRSGRVPPPLCTIEVRVGPWARLVGYGLSQARPNITRLSLYWKMESREAIPEDYHVFVHVVDGRTAELVAQADSPPCGGHCPTSLWRRGDLWIDEHDILPPQDSMTTGAPLLLKVGWYSIETGERVPAFGPEGDELPNAQIVLADLVHFYAGQPCGR